jgi:hypothetical protein
LLDPDYSTVMENLTMTRSLISAAAGVLFAAGLAAAPAHAAGCLKGAAVGGVAGHFLGHHALLGAGAGCLIGHHEAAKHARERAREEQAQRNYSGSNYGHSDYGHSDYGR